MQLTSDSSKVRLASSEVIPGGLADGLPNDMFPEDELNKGIDVELEHTNNPDMAEEISKDHLMEDGHYYDKLDRAGL